MKAIILALLVAAALAGGWNNGRRLTVRAGKSCSFNFGCGYERNNAWDWWTNDRYTYTCSGHPNWLTWDGSRLYGTAPYGWKGSFQVFVGYEGRYRGAQSYWITTEEYPELNSWNSAVWWYNGDWNYKVVCPTLQYNQVVVPEIKVEVPEIRIPKIEIKTPKIVVPTSVVAWTGNYDCGRVNWGGSAVITFVGDDYCTLDNGHNVYFTNCSSRKYRRGLKNFVVGHKVSYECFDDGNRVWAKRFDCSD